jgi:flagellar hook-associated protein 2
MATISSPGIGSGLDVKSIVAQLVELEKKPLTLLQTKATSVQARLSVVGQIQSQMAALDDALNKLTKTSTFEPMTVTSSNSAISGSAVFTASPATLTMEVSQVARSQSTASAAFSTGATVGSGTLSLQKGKWTGAVFDPGANTAVNIAIAATDTLSVIAGKINDAEAGVEASIMNDGTGDKLVLRSTQTGLSNGFRVQVTDDDTVHNDNSGLSRLGYDPAAGAFGMSLAQSALDTQATINGVPVSSANNQFATAISGVTLTVNQATTSPVTVTVKRDEAAVTKAIEGFVSAYNAASNMLKESTKYDAATGKAGALQGDTTVVALQSALRRLIGTPGPSGNALGRLSDAGIQLQTDGTLSINSSKLASAMSNMTNLQKFFTDDTSTAQGFAVQMRSFTKGLLGDSGRIGQKTKTMQDELTRNGKEQQKLSERISRTETRLLAQYNRMDANVAKLNSLNAYVTQQVTNWNKSTSS